MTLEEKIKSCKGRNQARIVLAEHCTAMGINYTDYEMTPEESRAYFSKLPFSPYRSFNHELAASKRL